MINLCFLLKCPENFILKMRSIIFPHQGETVWFRFGTGRSHS